MKSGLWSILVILMTITVASRAQGHTSYVGYSGAPGTNGRCAASCHGSSGGTIQVTGFPTAYVPGQVYTINVTHNGGSMIKQFNGSCRIGTGFQNAGVITASTNTVTYNTATETNGIHLTTIDTMGGDFVWTAPVAGTGDVRLYVAGHQGSSGGANTNIVLTATEQLTGIPQEDAGPPAARLLCNNSPNPFSGQTVITYFLTQESPVALDVYDAAGRRVGMTRSRESAGVHELIWNGAAYPSGVYFYRLQAGGSSTTRKMVLDK